MEGERLLHHKVLRNTLCVFSILLSCLLTGCTKFNSANEHIYITFDTGSYTVKSADPNEMKFSDVNLIIFDEYGRKEADLWIDQNPSNTYKLSLTSGKRYRFTAVANFGYRLNISHADQLKDVRYHLAYPDEYKNGIPMYADTGYILIKDGMTLAIRLIRLMSKVSIRIDRTRLSDNVEMNIAGVRIGNCPRSAHVFTNNQIKNPDECFPLGFNKTGEDCGMLNRMESIGLSYPVSLYMLENMQGRFAENDISEDSDKVFDEYDPRRETCSYIELDIDYLSATHASANGTLKYRFYLGEDRNNLNVERNCHYQITIVPEGDGLKEDGWRVDKSDLISHEPTTFSSYPESYIRGDIGDQIHIGCIFTPADASFDVGLEYMKNDRDAGIYDYVIDEDGHGAVLTLTGPGAGMIYMSAGPPVNESALWFIEVNLPPDNITSYDLPK